MGGISAIKGFSAEPLKIIPTPSGSVMHAMKASDGLGCHFGEVYFSSVFQGATKGWKRHKKMESRIVVPSGSIRFFLFDDRGPDSVYGHIDLGPKVNYQRITIPPGIWMAFQGLSEGTNLLLNLASIPHDPDEVDQLPITDTKFSVFKL
jgi:dTDP-4-dehydrorhamnose 3,5-epimerase